MDFKLRNNNDKTIFEIKLDDAEDEKIRPGKIILRLFIVIVAVAASIAAGYVIHRLYKM